MSVIVRNDKLNIVGVMPASLSNRTLHSHQGLSFGGLCIKKDVTTRMVMDMFNSILIFLKSTNLIDDLVYKRLPDFYTTYPAQEDLYALFKVNAELYRRDVTVAIDLSQRLAFNKMRKRHVKKAQKNDVIVSEQRDLRQFWELLTDVLRSHHNVDPVHQLSEIELLMEKFPSNIRCFVAKKDAEVIAGTLVFETDNVVHTQYLANGIVVRDIGGLDFLISELINRYSASKKYFNFGISTENEGTILNDGLIAQKEGFGARAFVHDFYYLRLEDVKL